MHAIVQTHSQIEVYMYKSTTTIWATPVRMTDTTKQRVLRISRMQSEMTRDAFAHVDVVSNALKLEEKRVERMYEKWKREQ